MQDHAVGTHGHEIDDPGHAHEDEYTDSYAYQPDGGLRPHFAYNRETNWDSIDLRSATGITVTTPTGANVSTETRPVNSAVNYIIKY